MFIIIIFLLGIIVALAYALLSVKRAQQGQGNLDRARAATQAAKEENKGKVLQLFSGKDLITNNDVQRLLGVSDATASNYLQELELAGIITQNTKTGRGVSYRKNG